MQIIAVKILTIISNRIYRETNTYLKQGFEKYTKIVLRELWGLIAGVLSEKEVECFTIKSK